jgi:malonyl-CoA O-methyltransferase
MNHGPNKIANREGYNLWSYTYDHYPNPTVAVDDRHFPAQWRHLTGRNVLEVGCGTGRHTSKLAAQGNQVTGIDISSGMLAVAREKLRGGSGVALLEGDFLSSNAVPEGVFDALVASLVIEHIRDLPAFFGRARRALRPVAEVHLSEIHPLRAAQGILAHFKMPDGEQFDLESVPHPEGAIESAAQSAGLELIDRLDAFGDKELSALNSKWERYLGVPMIRMWRFRTSP